MLSLKRWWLRLLAIVVGVFATERADANMTYHGGPVIEAPKLVVIYWGWNTWKNNTNPDPLGARGYLENKLIPYVGGSRFFNVLTQYWSENANGVWTGQVFNNTIPTTVIYDDTTTPSGASNDQPAAQEIGRLISNGTISASQHNDGNNIYVVLFPAYAVGPSTFCASHNWSGAVSNSGVSDPQVAFFWLPYWTGSVATGCDKSFQEYIGHRAMHEFAETVTDPQLNAWYSGDTSGEIGDACNDTTMPARLAPTYQDTTSVEALWSNQANNGQGACVFQQMGWDTNFVSVPGPCGPVTNCFQGSIQKTTEEYFYTTTSGHLANAVPGSSWLDLGQGSSPAFSKPSASSWTQGRVDAMMISTTGHMLHSWTDDGYAHTLYWDNWADDRVPAPYYLDTGSWPAVTSWGNGRLDVATIMQPGPQVLARSWDNGYDSGWWVLPSLPPGYQVASPPALTTQSAPDQRSLSSGVLELFVLCRYTDGTVNVCYTQVQPDLQQITSWHTFSSPTGGLRGTPVATSWGRGRVDVYDIDAFGTLQHLVGAGAPGAALTFSWDTGFAGQSPAGPFAASPAVAAIGDNRLVVAGHAQSNLDIWTHIWDASDRGWTDNYQGTLTPISYGGPAVTAGW